MHGDIYVSIVRDVLQVLGGAVEAAAEAALCDAPQLGLAAAVGLRLVQAVLKEETEDPPGDDEEGTDREGACRVAQRASDCVDDHECRVGGV